ncbi:nucleotide exchange factor GrpE [Lederbergia sp. NSJ-179]|uniref:nucleotide exchange factor GrpE n=1 Tax=Lederbergia sp. NSJ-179 TaxID=2931402 RepID=UPI001FD09E68|nr:nucleotide exchange factor GrpE [Lederbergia sp. NSJ-179]MCJ7843530.1 nucleotide exchange factor GrpE [Lederbergia sp. NSJ-179]
MNWKFWKSRKPSDQDIRLEQMSESITDLREQVDSTNEQMKKLIRLQFKSSKGMEDNFAKMHQLFQHQLEQDQWKQQVGEYEHKQNRTIQQLINLLDEFDRVADGLNEDQEAWRRLLAEWSQSLLDCLQAIGCYEVDVKGKSFDPSLSESMETVKKEEIPYQVMAPYQVVSVLKRGFTDQHGNMIRKSQVVTVKE